MSLRGQGAARRRRRRTAFDSMLRAQQMLVFIAVMARLSDQVARDPEMAAVVVAERARKLQLQWEAMR